MPFDFTETPIPGLIEIVPRRYADSRGFFQETYKGSDFYQAGISGPFVQDNHSYSAKNVIRGLHFQTAPHAQGKLVRVVAGRVWDVAVDLRPDSPSFTRWFGTDLTDENGRMLYIPPGFAHGFLALSDGVHLVYKCTAEYHRDSDAGVRWDDPDLAIEWPIATGDAIVSEKDQTLPYLKELP